MRNFFILPTFFFLFSTELFAMVAQPTKVVLWRKGESIEGETFIGANEEIVDYLATLRRPTGNFNTIKYNCLVKSHAVQSSVQRLLGGSTETEWVVIRIVYEMKDCVEMP